MRHACLIITYTSAVQTMRVIKKLDNGKFDFYIHLDKKIDMDTHRSLFDHPNVYFIKNRIKVNWAGFTIVQATFNGIKEIVASGREYDFINLLSGQDYPVKSADYISDFLDEHKGQQLINVWNFAQWEEALARINRFHLTDKIFKGKYFLERMLNWVAGKRPTPKGLTFYGNNSTFWTLSPDAAKYVVDKVESDQKLYNFFRYTWGSDEFVFQTMLMNSHFKDDVVGKNFRYTDWSAGGAHPKLLKTEDFEMIDASDAIFARKFNIAVDENVLDLIDESNKIPHGVHH
ncbi:beta-1,6-N-acetylglucosaminyltransferase [Mucilaginibacter ginkgonis]|uniref:Peptide O-xylosyltransferase n=1 Tax=Mucilaginibacter ginkgonis TaxID=2682091 RepID=A0A6I4IMP0_9SPHI|nr:beta-1,6-N-acetylglucosaminyltransferase [Mucilaginibacter ginkgonis]QQL50318.1 glycosyltransferase [Mucilaginibacter ginkgonis]